MQQSYCLSFLSAGITAVHHICLLLRNIQFLYPFLWLLIIFSSFLAEPSLEAPETSMFSNSRANNICPSCSSHFFFSSLCPFFSSTDFTFVFVTVAPYFLLKFMLLSYTKLTNYLRLSDGVKILSEGREAKWYNQY